MSGGFSDAVEQLGRAAWWIARGVPYLATHPDTTCPTNTTEILQLDCGAWCAALAAACGRQPDIIVGKPNPCILNMVMEQYHLHPQEIVVVGDRLDTDMALAHNVGAAGVLILTGETNEKQAVAASHQPDLIVPDLPTLTQILRDSPTFLSSSHLSHETSSDIRPSRRVPRRTGKHR